MTVPALILPPQVAAEPGDFVEIHATLPGSGASQAVRWLNPDGGLRGVPPSMLRDTRTGVFVAPKAGVFTVLAWTAVDGEPTEAASCQVVVGSPPAPKPPAAPSAILAFVKKIGVSGWLGILGGLLATALTVFTVTRHTGVTPAPAPAPGTKAVWAVAVTNKSAPLDDASKVLLSPSLRKALEASGHTLRWYDQNQDYAKSISKHVAKAGGIPALVILEKGGPNDGAVLSAVRLPATEAAFIDAVHKAGGK